MTLVLCACPVFMYFTHFPRNYHMAVFQLFHNFFYRYDWPVVISIVMQQSHSDIVLWFYRLSHDSPLFVHELSYGCPMVILWLLHGNFMDVVIAPIYTVVILTLSCIFHSTIGG